MVQIPNGRKAFWSFEIEIWDLFGIWNLASGISTLFGSGYAGLGYWEGFAKELVIVRINGEQNMNNVRSGEKKVGRGFFLLTEARYSFI